MSVLVRVVSVGLVAAAGVAATRALDARQSAAGGPGGSGPAEREESGPSPDATGRPSALDGAQGAAHDGLPVPSAAGPADTEPAAVSGTGTRSGDPLDGVVTADAGAVPAATIGEDGTPEASPVTTRRV